MSEETKKPTKKISVKEKIIRISNELRLDKDGKNTFQNYQYFKPDDIARAINPLLEKYEVIAHFDMPFSKDKGMYEGKLTIENISDNESISYNFDIPLTELKGTGMAQNAGATMTYCKRYMLMNIFNIADNSADPDNEKNKPAEKVDYASKLSVSKTLVELQKTWASIPAISKGELFTLKEELKTKLSK